MRTITCFGDRTSGTLLIIALSLGRKENVSKREKNLSYCLAGKVEKKKREIWKWEQLLTLVIGQAALSL